MSEKIKIIPVTQTMPADLLTPLSVYLKLSRSADASFLLESVEGGESLARYSFIGSDPHMIVNGDARGVTIRDASGTRALQTPMFEFLRDHFARYEVETDGEAPPFIGGGIGYLGFGCAGWFEPTLRTDETTDAGDGAMMFFRSVIAFDHVKQIINLISLVFADAGADQSELHRDAVDRNAMLRDILENAPVSVPESKGTDGNTVVESNWTRDAFENAVGEIKEHIAAGECYQVVLSQRFSRQTSANPVAIYRAVRSLNPSPYMFLLDMRERCVIGASPEMLVKCSGRDLEYRPIAGTRQRGKTADEDARLAGEMRSDPKEVAEHLMLVDLGRNDLGRVAEYGSVNVENLMSVEKYSHVQHLVSYLSARLRPDLDRFDALTSCFPAGTVSGAPKVRAIEIIRRMEPTARNVYAGAVGYFDYAGNMDTCIAIRTLVLENGVAEVQAGAGIVADSVPEREFEETVSKARALLKAIELAEANIP